MHGLEDIPQAARNFPRAALLLAALASVPVTGVAAPLALDPESACTALADAGLGARGGYRGNPGERYRCDSRRKPIVAGNAAQDEVRFSALGTERAVDELRLVLTIRSRGDIQRAHRKLADYASQLADSVLHVSLPAAANEAILSGVSGKWESGGREFQVRRDTVADGLYALRLNIR